MSVRSRVYRERRLPAERPLAAIIAGLWRNGEQGVRFEASDLSTMFQDAAGTLPVYAPGQGQVDPPVGLWLDKRLGLSKGQERLTNGDFTSTAGWVESGVGVTLSAAAGELQVTSASPLGAYQQPNNFVVGRWYVVTGQIRVGSAASVSIRTVAGGSSLGTMVAESQVVTSSAYVAVSYIFQATNTANAIYLRVGTTNSTAFFKSLSVRELPGNHAYQATTTSRPTLSARYNMLISSEEFGGAAWLRTECSVINNVTTGPSGRPAEKIVPSTVAAAHSISQSVTSGPESRIARVVVKADGCDKVTMYPGSANTFANFDLTTASYAIESGVTSAEITSLGDGWYECSAIWPAGPTLSTFRIYTSNGTTGASAVAGDGVSGLIIDSLDIRPTNDGVGLPKYQQVVNANTYDASGFPLYLKFDGVDDSLQTAAVDFSGVTAVLVMAAVRKLSDASRGIIVELGASGYGHPGSFNIEQAWFSPNWSSSYSGAIGNSTVTEPGIAAPASAVVGSYADQGAPSIQLRHQGKARASSTAAVGGGGFLNAPVYIGRRGGSSSAANMRLYGLLVRGGPAADNQVAAVGKRLNQQARIY